uniref:Uncharacterized protein n=1 Tax=Cacopsylla melanoneura TaxID=428564 RepID=A0A8D8S2X2_9HEMI
MCLGFCFFCRQMFDLMRTLGPSEFLQPQYRHLLQENNMSETEFRSKFQRWMGVAEEQPVPMAMHFMADLINSSELHHYMFNGSTPDGPRLAPEELEGACSQCQAAWYNRTHSCYHNLTGTTERGTGFQKAALKF